MVVLRKKKMNYAGKHPQGVENESQCIWSDRGAGRRTVDR